MDVGALCRRVRHKNPDLTSPETKKTLPTDFITFPQVARTARAKATSLVRETRGDRYDLKGRPPHVTTSLDTVISVSEIVGLIVTHHE